MPTHGQLDWLRTDKGEVFALGRGSGGPATSQGWEDYGCTDEDPRGRLVIERQGTPGEGVRRYYRSLDGMIRLVREVPGAGLPPPENDCSVQP